MILPSTKLIQPIGKGVIKGKPPIPIALNTRAKGRDLVCSSAEQFVGVRDVLRGVCGSHATKEHEHNEHCASNDNELAQGRTSLTKLRPLATSVAGVVLECFGTKLVVDHTAEGNAVTKELKATDLRSPDKHRGSNQQNILEYTAKCQDQG